MHAGNFGFDKIIPPSVRTSTFHASVVEGIYNVCLNRYGQYINSRQKTTSADQCHMTVSPVSYTHLTLPTKRIV